MSNGFASALEISARHIRENGVPAARGLIAERLHSAKQSQNNDGKENGYLLNMREGYRAVLAGIDAVEKRSVA